MEAPLGKIVRKILTNEDASKKLMQQIILGERFNNATDVINIDDRRFKIQRLASIDSTDKHVKK